MIFKRVRIMNALLLLILNELCMRINGAEFGDFMIGRSAQPTTTTICVEIKPSGPLEQPYYMCRGGELPGFPKMPGNSPISLPYKTENKQMNLPNAKKDHYEISYNNRGGSESANEFKESSGQYSSNSSGGGNKQINTYPAAESRSFNGPTNPGSNSGIDVHFQEHSPYHHHHQHQHAQQYQHLPYGQEVQPQMQPIQHPQQQHQRQQPMQFHQQQQQQQQNQPHEFPQTSNDYAKNSSPGDRARDYNPMFPQGAIEHPAGQQPVLYPSHSMTSIEGHPTDSSSSSQKNPASHAKGNNKTFKMSQQDEPECEGDCPNPINKSSVDSDGYDGRYNGKQSFRNEAGTSIFKPNAHIIATPNANDGNGNTQLHQNNHFSTQNPGQNLPVAANERAMAHSAIAPAVHRPSPFPPSHSPDMRHQVPVNQHTLHQVQPGPALLPAPAHRYRDMIDDDVLQVPDWAVSQDELNFYRSRIEPERKIAPGVLNLQPTPRTIPLEHLEDPVMRSFYNSLPDASLPIFKPAYTASHQHPQPQRKTQAPYMSPPAVQQLQPQPQPQPQPIPPPTPAVCSPCPAPPQPYNYNPCAQPGGYSFHPFFFAMPCYNPPIYQPMIPQLPFNYPNTQFQGVAHKELGMANPLTLGSPHITSTPATLTQTEASTPSINNPNMTSTTPATTAANDSNESAEDSDEIEITKELAILNANGNSPKKENNNPQESPKILSDNLNGFNGPKNLNSTEPSRQSLTTTSTTAKSEMPLYPVTTPTSLDRNQDDPLGQQEQRTTFRSLFLNARKLAQMVNDDYDPFASDTSTPKTSPKKQRQAAKSDNKGKM